MPQQQEKQKQKVSTDPTPGLMQRLFGSGVMSPEMQEGLRIAKSENPNLAPVQPYGFFSRIMQPNALAYASPGRNIYINPSTMAGQSPQDIADTITHEQEHVGQMRERGHSPFMEFLSTFGDREPYYRRPDEMGAFQAEIARRARMGRTQTGVPSFTTGEPIAPGDIYLRPEKGIKVGPTSQALNKLTRR